MPTLSSAKSYTSTVGNTSSAFSSGSSTSASSSGSSLYVSRQHRMNGRILQLANSGLLNYSAANRQAGDIFFHGCEDGGAGHTNMTGPDVAFKIDSVDPDGVRRVRMDRDENAALVYRFMNRDVAQRAALLAASWAPADRYDPAVVGYSGGAFGLGVTGRVIGALLGTSSFGSGAKARLLKYRSRPGQTPRNVICSEMCILAFQLSMAESDAGFIKLDAKHSLPLTLMKYMQAHPLQWELVAVKRGVNDV